jgi:hypothetical protein
LRKNVERSAEHVVAVQRHLPLIELIVVHAIGDFGEAPGCADRNQRRKAVGVSSVRRQIDDSGVIDQVRKRCRPGLEHQRL